jgi:hypothetical protein
MQSLAIRWALALMIGFAWTAVVAPSASTAAHVRR